MLKSPQGAPAGVYQLQVLESDQCVTAEDNNYVTLAACAANPGKPQRWKVDATGGWGKIESRAFPGYALENSGSTVRFVQVSGADTQKWSVGPG
ncbi:hypothetical protein AMK09_07150 [Streptomyces sp. CB02488]|uniref:ricin-type beta-trefoil lectin domain protein n=1 Tax=Streptomyces sp. CB02488 TaxID=1703920 RepID=UPI00093C08BE|nr:ricin-type beta-trefoil lectin domain protein [Streptomyces sp. CB02488]OKK23093.1 hypothetical protein AMK09_07150 [Streptomyces sp. CB02488]